MKRLVATLALLLAASSTEAKLLVVTPERADATGGATANDPNYVESCVGLATAMLDALGVDYKLIKGHQTKTEWCRTGTQVWGEGAGASTEQFDAVLYLHHGNGNLFRLWRGGTQRPDSIGLANLAGGAPTVPQIFWGFESNFSTGAPFADSSGQNSGGGGYPAIGVNYYHPVKYLAIDPTIRWRSPFLDGMTFDYVPAGGTRILVGQNFGAANQRERDPIDFPGDSPCQDCDSITVTGDSALCWVRLNNNFSPPGSPIVYIINNHINYQQQDPIIPLIALAYVDSVTGGKIFTKNPKLPLSIGFHIRSGWRRSIRSVAGGISPNDSTVLKASIDSLASLKVPFVVGVNVDSLEGSPDDRNWWRRASPYVHYTPENYAGIDTANGSNGKASWQQPRDVFGRYRNRSIVDNDGGDSSITRLARAAFWKCDSAFGKNFVDRVMIPPDDDWWAYNWRPGRASSARNSIDSLFAGLADSAGVRGIVINPTADGQRSGDVNPKSPIRAQMTWPITSGRNVGSRFKVFSTQAQQDSGSARWNRSFTVDVFEPGSPLLDVQSFWNSAFGFKRQFGATSSGPGGNLMPGDSLRTKMSIFTIHVSDLGSGKRADSGIAPTRPGWWQIKYIVREAQAVNRQAGRTIIDIKYPEDIEP